MVTLGIVGAGIGGCSAAYFAHKHLANSKVTVYEAENRIGGRTFTYYGPKTQKELGAEFFNFSNKIVSGLVAELGLQTKKLDGLMDIAVWDGNEFVFQFGQSLFHKMFGLVSKHKLSVPKLLFSIKKAEWNIKKLYKEQKKGPVEFSSLFEGAGLDEWYKTAFDEILLERGIDQSFIDELVTPSTRLIYCQNADLGGFAGLVAIMGIYSQDINKIKDGNETFPQKLVEVSGAKVELETKVDAVESLSDGSFRVFANETSSVYDAVIVASPLEVANISFDGISLQNQLREYQTIYARIMRGQINPGYFNLDSSKVPSLVLTTKDANPLVLFSIKHLPDKGESLVTVTSLEPLGDSFVDEFFKKGETVFDHSWSAAYPVFKPIQKVPDMVLDDNLFYLNGIESAASSLETSAFAAQNSVQALKESLG